MPLGPCSLAVLESRSWVANPSPFPKKKGTVASMAQSACPLPHSGLPLCILFLEIVAKPWDVDDGVIWDKLDYLWLDKLQFPHRAQNIEVWGRERAEEVTCHRREAKPSLMVVILVGNTDLGYVLWLKTQIGNLWKVPVHHSVCVCIPHSSTCNMQIHIIMSHWSVLETSLWRTINTGQSLIFLDHSHALVVMVCYWMSSAAPAPSHGPMAHGWSRCYS